MKTLRIPLVGSITNRRDAVNFTGDQVFINCYPEIVRNTITGKTTAYLTKRPGSAAGSALSGVASSCKSGAIFAWAGHTSTEPIITAAFLVTGGTSTSVWNLNTDAKIGGDIPTTDDCTVLTETKVNAVSHIVGNFYDSATGALEQWFYPDGGAWTQVTSATLTSRTLVGAPVHMDGYTFNMTQDGKIIHTDLNTVSSIAVTNVIDANDHPDKGVALARQGSHILGFGERSIQPFYNAGNATGSVLSRVQGGTIPMGAARTETAGGVGKTTFQSVITANGTVYWLGVNSDGAPIGVFRMKGLSPEKVSNALIDRMLGAGQLKGFAGTFYMGGSHHVVLNQPGGGASWAYCIDTDFWWKFVLATGGLRGALGSAASQLSMTGATHFTASANATGNSTFATASPTAVHNQDSTSTYTMTVQTANMELGTNRKKYYSKLAVVYDRQASTSAITVSASDNDYASFSTLGTIDTVSSNAQSWLTRLGASRRRAWKLEHSAATPFRAETVEIEYEEGSS